MRRVQPASFEPVRSDDHALIDSGEGEKLERYGEVVLARPDPQALWRRRRPEEWEQADLRFVRESDRGGRWEVRRGAPPFLRAADPSWTVRFGTGRFVIRPTSFKHVGMFPEQAANWEWTRGLVGSLGDGPRLLNLFGYTGVASVLAAQSGYEVTHVDASRTSLAWMRENVQASGLDPGAVRIVLDDALTFARREVRRQARYAGILVDPPHYGRGPKREVWRFETDLAPLVEACGRLLAERSFLILSSYAIGFSPLSFANLLLELEGGTVDAGELVLLEEPLEGAPARRLPCGFCARWRRG